MRQQLELVCAHELLTSRRAERYSLGKHNSIGENRPRLRSRGLLRAYAGKWPLRAAKPIRVQR